MKKILTKALVVLLLGFSLTIVGCNSTQSASTSGKVAEEKQSSFTEKEVQKAVDGIYKALINKNSDEYINYINGASLQHLGSSGEEIKKTIDTYLKSNDVKEYKILSTEDFNENTKIINTRYVEISKEGTKLEHEDMLFLQKNSQNKVEIIYNGAISSEKFPVTETPEGQYKFALEKTMGLFDGIGAMITIENKTDYKVSLGYGKIFGNVIITTEDGETYTLPFDEVKLYAPNTNDKISSFTYETTDKISKVEIQGVFELNENGTPKEGSPKTYVIFES